MPEAPKLAFRAPKCKVLDHYISDSGKYFCFFGTHVEAGLTCWVYGTSNAINGEIVMRHFNEKIPGCLAPEAVAKDQWEEFKSLMQRKPDDAEYEESYLERLKEHIN